MSTPKKEAVSPPKEIQLEEVEMLRLELVQLKIAETEQVHKRLSAKRKEIAETIEKRLGIKDLRRYMMDIDTGEGRLMEGEKK